MSFEPTIIINKKHLNKPKVIKVLEEEQYSSDEEVEKVAKFLLNAKDRTTLKFGKLELVICRPEFTAFNEAVRDRLTELEVEYQIDA